MLPTAHLVQRLLLGLALLCAAALAPVARAQTAGVVDPPARVGRLADLQGTVWFFDTQTGEWQTAARNRPVTTGDRLSTDNGARAEVRVGPNSLRLDGGSEIEVLQLDDQSMRVQLHSGSLALRLHAREAASGFEIDTAEGRLTPQRAGYYRVDRTDEVTAATVWDGAMHFEASDSALDIAPGQRVEFWRDGPTHYSTGEPARDAFSSWALARDRSDERSASTRYVSPEMTGWEDLDRYGRWETTPDYGPLWVPMAVEPDWAPYRYGQWAWVSPWGWTWVDNAPWGFAPFHYGRWVWFRSHWCWTPGAYAARPVYAPALVAWVGGPNVSVSISIGSRSAPPVGWFPLAPREVYVPGYRHSPTYIQNINITHVTNVTVINQAVQRPPTQYVNRQVFNAVTVVPADVLSQRKPVAPAVMRGNEVQQIVQAGVHHQPPVTPPAPARAVNFAPGATAVPPPPGGRAAEVRRVQEERRERHEGPRAVMPPAREPAMQSQPATPAARPTTPTTTAPTIAAPPRPAAPQVAAPPAATTPAPTAAPTPAPVVRPPAARVVPPPPRGEPQSREERREERVQPRAPAAQMQREVPREAARELPAPPREVPPPPRETRRAEPPRAQPHPPVVVPQAQPQVQPQAQPQPQPQQAQPQQAQPQGQPQAVPAPPAEGRKQVPRPPGVRERQNEKQNDERRERPQQVN
jgi:hypothetical protein